MGVVLNEREYAQDMLDRCTLGQKPIEAMGYLARYYMADGYKRREIVSLLEEFMMKCDPAVNMVKWQAAIEQKVRSACRTSLVELDSIPITQRELDLCGSLRGTQMRRLLFTLICLAKFADAVNGHNGGWVNRPDNEIFRMANIVTPVKRQSLMLNDLRDLGMIRFSRKVDNVNIKVECADPGGDAVLHITDFRNLGYQYMRHCDEYGGKLSAKPQTSYFECEVCGIVEKRTGNRQKYCKECGIEMNRQKSMENRRKGLAS